MSTPFHNAKFQATFLVTISRPLLLQDGLDPFMSFVHSVLSGILHMAGLQEELVCVLAIEITPGYRLLGLR